MCLFGTKKLQGAGGTETSINSAHCWTPQQTNDSSKSVITLIALVYLCDLLNKAGSPKYEAELWERVMIDRCSKEVRDESDWYVLHTCVKLLKTSLNNNNILCTNLHIHIIYRWMLEFKYWYITPSCNFSIQNIDGNSLLLFLNGLETRTVKVWRVQ